MQVDNKTDTRVVNEKRSFSFCVNKLHDMIRTRKFNSCQNQKKCVLNSWKKYKKNSFSFCSFLVIGWCFILNRKKIKRRKIKKWVSYPFSLKKYFFGVKWKLTKENWHIWNKKELIKKTFHVENVKKKSFVMKNIRWIKEDRESVTRPKSENVEKNLKNKKIELG